MSDLHVGPKGTECHTHTDIHTHTDAHTQNRKGRDRSRMSDLHTMPHPDQREQECHMQSRHTKEEGERQVKDE